VDIKWEMLLDSREKPKFKQLVRKKYPTFRETALDADLVLRQITTPVQDVVGIERKVIGDLVQSIQTQRFFSQLKKLKHHFKIPMLMIVGDLTDYKTKMWQSMKLSINDSVIYGSIASAVVREHIHVMWFPDDHSLIEVVYRILKKVTEGKYGEERRIQPKLAEYDPIKVLMHVPGITQSISKNIFRKYRSLDVISQLSIDQLKTVDGVGQHKAHLIWKLFHLKV